VVLGEVGRNFGAGMSGGVAYVYNPKGTFEKNCNTEGLNLDPVVDDQDFYQLKILIENHFMATSSPLAKRLLENWKKELPKFIKVLPEEYRQALIRLEEEQMIIA
jgi:glutamate synthase (ferredoxin)